MYRITNFFIKAYEFVGNVFVALFNLVCSSVIIGVNIYVSFNHTLILFSSVNWFGNIGLAATIGCELAFIQSSVNMMICSLKRKRPSVPITFVFSIGTGLIMWSNISSTLDSPSHWVVCLLLGLVPPLMMWGSKGVLADSLMRKKTKQTIEQPEPPMEQTEEQPVQQTEKQLVRQTEEQLVQQTELEQTELEQTEPEQTEPERTESEQIELEQTRTKRTKYTDEQMEAFKDIAVRYFSERGCLPKVREFAEIAGVKPNIANKVLKPLREEKTAV